MSHDVEDRVDPTIVAGHFGLFFMIPAGSACARGSRRE